MDVRRVQLEQDFPSVKSPQRKISAPLPTRSVDPPPQRKTSVNVIKRSPVTFVISNDKGGRTEGTRNASEYQPPSGVSFMNSRFVPLNQEEAEDYSMMKRAEARKSSTVTMSSTVTVHGGSAGSGVVRKLGISALQQPPLNDSLPTEERFAALSEKYASLKAKIGASDSKQKNQDSSPKPVEKSDYGQNTEDKLTQSKCWTTVESIQVQNFEDRVSDTRVNLAQVEAESTLITEDGGKQKKDSEEHGIHSSRMTITSSDVNDMGVIKTTSNMKENNIENIDENNNSKYSITKIQVENDEIQTSSSIVNGKSTLHLRPESPAQRSRTTVVAKLMNRKLGPRRKQSIVPHVAKRRSKVYTENAQFEKIRTVVENTVLRAPVRQQALTIQELLNGLSSCLTEGELVAIFKECSKTLRTLDALGSLPSYVSLESVIINPSGTIKFKHLSTGISIDDLYLAQNIPTNLHPRRGAGRLKRVTSSTHETFTCVFSLAATLWSAADWRLTEAEKPSLSPRFQELLVSMTDDAPDARPGLYDVLQTCESLQTEGDMTSRERCQALLWEYQASAAMENDDVRDSPPREKTVEEDKKHHDTLMGSISVAASFKGFLKQTAKPQERNPFVKTQNKPEPSNKIDGNSAGEILTNKTIYKPEKVKAEKNIIVENSPKLNVTTINSSNSDKEIPSSDSSNVKAATASDANNNQDPARDRKRGASLTEDQKEQLLSLLASTKLNKSPFYTGDNDRRSEVSSKPVEEQSIKPPSPSLYAYPHYGQTEAQMMFSPITPAGRSVSPSVHSDISENQIPSVPNATFLPIAVPVPSVTPVVMPPFWYMPQGGMMPYPQAAMSPVPYVPHDPSVTSNQSVVSTDSSDVSEVSDADPRPKKTSSAMPRFDKSETSKSNTEQRTRCSPALQNNKGSKLPRPTWKTPVAKGRTTPVEAEANSNVVRRRVSITDEFNEQSEDTKPVRARTPSPSLGRRASPKAVTPPRSKTPPVYWNREGVDMPTNNKPHGRASTGSLSNSPSSSPDRRRRSSTSPSGSAPNSPAQRSRSQSRSSSPAGSRSNSPVSMLVSKFEQISQESTEKLST
ncbi:cerebellar granular layer formation [Desmophyllum pertusum]|uniref:Cerebellar granular layer formation n=1 Tax=Desmophyllum pertusum TaxID=174260 RepID=A0A9W9YCC9_9CNID|nr:cerebellar granular layer formation [Desmophyllum pertusum]